MINVVGAVLLKKNSIILAKRSNNLKNFPNLFEFPGGKIEEGETPKEALKRELFEELEINVNIVDIHEFLGNQHSHTIEKSGKVIHLTLFIVKKWQGNIKIQKHIHSNLAYVDIKNLHTFTGFIPGDAEFIPAIKIAL
tara:strand:- start:10835 stop:11248 length:414 start_codon:yes stop_codon:yes gene_type:complete